MKINIDTLNFDDWSDTTKDIRKRQLKTLNLIMGNSSEIFDTVKSPKILIEIVINDLITSTDF